MRSAVGIPFLSALTSGSRQAEGGEDVNEHGAIQASNVLSSPRAIEMGLYVVRAFVQLRETLRFEANRASNYLWGGWKA